MINIEKKEALSVMFRIVDNYFKFGDGSQQLFITNIINKRFNTNLKRKLYERYALPNKPKRSLSQADFFNFASNFISLNTYMVDLSYEKLNELFPSYESDFNNLYQKMESIIVAITKKFLSKELSDIFSTKHESIENDLRSIERIFKSYFIFDKYKTRYIYWKMKELIVLGFKNQEKIYEAINLFFLQNPYLYKNPPLYITKFPESYFYHVLNKRINIWENNPQRFKFDMYLIFSIVNHNSHFPTKEITL